MRSHLTLVAKHSFVYGVGGAALQLVGLVTFPILAHAFVPSTYGVLEVAVAVFTVALTIADFGFVSASQRSYYDHPDADRAARESVLTTALAGTTVVALLCAAGLVAFRNPLAEWLFGERQSELMLLVAAGIVVANLAAFVRQVFRLRLQPWHFTAATVLASVCAAAVIVVGVTRYDGGAEVVFLGLLVGNAVGLIYALAFAYDAFGRTLSRFELTRMVRFGVPLLPAALAMWALMLVDRLMLSRLSGLGEVGQYAAANRVAAVLLLVTTAVATAYGPYALSLYASDRALEKEVRARVLVYLAAALTLVCVVLSLFARELLAVLAPGYDRAYQAVLLLSLGGVALGLGAITMSGISFARRTMYFATLSIAAAGVNIALNLVLIPPFGMIGAAVATTAGLAFLASAYYVVSQRLYRTPYEPVTVIAIVAAGAVAGSVGLAVFESAVVGTMVKLAALVGFLGALRLLGVVSGSHLREIASALTAVLRSREAT